MNSKSSPQLAPFRPTEHGFDAGNVLGRNGTLAIYPPLQMIK
jgi:hypothetical protein